MIPTEKSFGVVITLLKSWIVSPSPRPNIIKAKAIGAIEVTISMVLSCTETLRIYKNFKKLQLNLKL